MLFSVGLLDFDWTYASFNPRKTYKTRDSVFSQRLSMTWLGQSDVKFYGESYDAYRVTVAHCTKKFYTKNLEKVGKIMNIQENSKKFKHFSVFLSVCLHMKRSKIKHLTTEKTSKNPRNSAYLSGIADGCFRVSTCNHC